MAENYTITKENLYSLHSLLKIKDIDIVDPDFNKNNVIDKIILNSKNNFKSNYPVDIVIIDNIKYNYNNNCYEEHKNNNYDYDEDNYYVSQQFDNILGFPLKVCIINNNMKFTLSRTADYYTFTDYDFDTNGGYLEFQLPKEIYGIPINHIDLKVFYNNYKYYDTHEMSESSDIKYPNVTLILQKDIKYTFIDYERNNVENITIDNNMINTIVMYESNGINNINICIKNIIYNDVKYEFVKNFGAYFINPEFVTNNMPKKLLGNDIYVFSKLNNDN